MKQITQQLVEKVYRAFENTHYPGDYSIVNSGHCSEHKEAENFFRGEDWKNLAKTDIELPAGYADLNFLSPEAWRFYLPAYLIQVLIKRDNDVEQHLVFQLTPPELSPYRDQSDPVLVKHFQENINDLSKQQCEIIVEFLQNLQEECPEEYTEIYPLTRIINFWQTKAVKL